MDLGGRLKEFADSAFGFLRSQKETYDAGSRFLKMRVWIVGILALDLVLTLSFVLMSGQSFDVEVWFEPGFPSNMLVVKNQTGDPLEDVTLVLDGRYTLQVDRIEEGPNGFEVNHAFHDAQDSPPVDTYRPAQLELRIKSHVVRVPIGAHGGPSR